MQYFAFLLIVCVGLIVQGCDIRGANDPYAYAPHKRDQVWNPPCKAEKRIEPSLKELEWEGKDYESFSKEAPLSLAEMIDIALVRSPSTRKSWAAARVSAAEYGQSLKDFFIQADIDGNYARTRYAAFTGRARSIIYETEYGGELDLTYTILDFGQTRMTSQAALQSLYNADFSHNSQIQQTIQTVMNDYYYYLYHKELLLASEQDVINAQVSLNSTEEKFRQGLADVSDIVQARTSFLSQKLGMINQKQTLHNAYTTLISTLGLPSNSAYYFQDYPKEIEPIHLAHLDKLIVKANHYRPDLRAAESRVKSSLATLTSAKLKKFPIITGEFKVGRQYYQHGVNDHYDFTGQVNLVFPLFQGFFIENSIKKARAELEESKASLEQTQLNIIEEVSNYRSDLAYSQESLVLAKNYLVSAEEDFKVNLKKYRVGTGDIVQLINAQTAVADARAKLAKAEYSWYSSLANLSYATGILFLPKENSDLKALIQHEGQDS